MFFNLTTKTIMKKIILTSLLFSLATLVNATPTDITTSPTLLSINENTATGTTIGMLSTIGANGGVTYVVNNTDAVPAVPAVDSHSFDVNVKLGSAIGGGNFIVQDTNGNNHIIANATFSASNTNDYPAMKLATAINDYNTANGSGVSATATTNSIFNGTVRLNSWPSSLNGAELMGFVNAPDSYSISISGNTIIPTPTAAIPAIPATVSSNFSTTADNLVSSVIFNHEEKASYTIVIRATDSTGSYSENFTININNLPDTPTDIIPNTTTLSIQENNSIGDIIGTFSTVDGNGGNHTYTLTGENSASFLIDGDELKANKVFDFETQSTYTVTINTDDGTAFHTYSKDFTITIIDDTNESLSLLPTTVAEHNAIGTTVGILVTVGGTGPYTYSIATNKNFTFTVEGVNRSNPARNEFYAIEPDGTSELVARVDYSYLNDTSVVDKLISGSGPNDFAINSTGLGGFDAEKVDEETVRLTDWDDKYDGGQFVGPAPNSTDDDGNPIDYIKIGTDPSSSSVTLPFQGYSHFSIKDDKLITTAVLDQATQSSYDITINSTDANNIVVSRYFKIIVAEGPSGTVTGITISKDTITNKASDGATVGLLATNANDTRRVYVLENNTATFSISNNKLTANNPGSLTASATYTVRISTLSGDNTIFTQSLTITVTNETAFSLDVDGNGSLSSSNDGLVIFKYLLNPNSNNLHTTIANNAMEGRKTTAQLKAYLDNAMTILDIDGNGALSSSNDGLVIFKYLLNPNSNNLHTTIANNALEGRKTTAELKAYLDLYID